MSRAAATHVDGALWMSNGQTVVTGAARAWMEQLDDAVVAFARSLSAEEFAFPSLIAASDLAPVEYLRSFPHLATFPVTLRRDPAVHARFADAGALDDSGALQLTETEPPRELLAPSACYPLYIQIAGTEVGVAHHYTMRATCFRREAAFVPLERQWSFSMREVVHAGGRDETGAFLAKAARFAVGLAGSMGLETELCPATDPFFRAETDPRHLMQRVDGSKLELTFASRLAIASINQHHDHFGRAYAITCRDAPGEPATSACVAFGLERWLSAMGTAHGADPSRWPAPAVPS
jgi:hypothetical protein